MLWWNPSSTFSVCCVFKLQWWGTGGIVSLWRNATLTSHGGCQSAELRATAQNEGAERPLFALLLGRLSLMSDEESLSAGVGNFHTAVQSLPKMGLNDGLMVSESYRNSDNRMSVRECRQIWLGVLKLPSISPLPRALLSTEKFQNSCCFLLLPHSLYVEKQGNVISW